MRVKLGWRAPLCSFCSLVEEGVGAQSLWLSSPTTMLLYFFCSCSLKDSFTFALFSPPSLQMQPKWKQFFFYLINKWEIIRLKTIWRITIADPPALPDERWRISLCLQTGLHLLPPDICGINTDMSVFFFFFNMHIVGHSFSVCHTFWCMGGRYQTLQTRAQLVIILNR